MEVNRRKMINDDLKKSNKNTKKIDDFCEYFELGAVRRCVNLVDFEKIMLKNEYIFGCKNRLR